MAHTSISILVMNSGLWLSLMPSVRACSTHSPLLASNSYSTHIGSDLSMNSWGRVTHRVHTLRSHVRSTHGGQTCSSSPSTRCLGPANKTKRLGGKCCRVATRLAVTCMVNLTTDFNAAGIANVGWPSSRNLACVLSNLVHLVDKTVSPRKKG
jgi:hypothetical protein